MSRRTYVEKYAFADAIFHISAEPENERNPNSKLRYRVWEGGCCVTGGDDAHKSREEAREHLFIRHAQAIKARINKHKHCIEQLEREQQKLTSHEDLWRYRTEL